MAHLVRSLFFAAFLTVPAAAEAADCDADCLIGIAEEYMDAVVATEWNDIPLGEGVVDAPWSGLPWGETVRFTENGVAMMVGEGLWGPTVAIEGEPFIAADPVTGNVVWFGLVREHGLAAYYAMRLKIEDRRIAEVETILGREGAPGPFASPAGYEPAAVFARTLPKDERRPRQRMIALVEGYYGTKQLNDGTILTEFDADCERVINGLSTTHGDHWAAQAAKGCKAQFEIGLYKPVDRIRERRYPVVDEERGIVIALSLTDYAARYVSYETTDGREQKIEIEYPNTRGMVEMFKIRDGKILRIEGVSAFLPYYMRTPWAAQAAGRR